MDPLKLSNQLCFPLYAAARDVVKRYTPFLQDIGLTYTQYITMMVLWEEKQIGVKQLGDRLYLDSGTLTPLLKKLEKQGLVTRTRSLEDERNLNISITPAGEALKAKAADIPAKMMGCISLDFQEVQTLHALLYKLLGNA